MSLTSLTPAPLPEGEGMDGWSGCELSPRLLAREWTEVRLWSSPLALWAFAHHRLRSTGGRGAGVRDVNDKQHPPAALWQQGDLD